MKLMQRIDRTGLAFLLTLLLVCGAGAQDKGMTPELVVDLQRVVEAAISPSGDNIAYSLTAPRSADEEPGSSFREIYVIPYSGGEAKLFASKENSSKNVAWSPDGNTLTFLSKRKPHDEHIQIYQMQVTGGEAVRLTDHETDIKDYKWSPDGGMIAFLATDALTEKEKAARERGEDWEVYDENFKQHRLWILDLASGESKKLFEDAMSVWDFTWTPDSKSLIAQATTTPLIDDSYVYKKLYRIPLQDGVPLLVTETEGKLGSMAISPDGQYLAYLGAVSLNDPIAASLFIAPVAGGEARNLTKDMEATGDRVAWLDNDSILLLSVQDVHTVLRQVDVDGEINELFSPETIVEEISLDKKRERFAVVGHSPDHPQEVFSGSTGSKKLTRLTHHNQELTEIQLAKQEVIEWSGADEWPIRGILTYPLQYQEGQRYPLILQIHGGPEGVSLDGWTTTATYPVQVLAANGYMVLQPNYRGSAGRGVAFSKADHDDLGGKEFEDVLAGIDALVERGLVDGDRVGTGGWSYGGYFSAWAATRHSERFKASVVAAGLTNWISFTGTTDIPHEMSLVHWNSYWLDERDLHWERSPLYHIDKANTPTLVVHGLVDERVHPEQGIELYTTLKLKGVPSQLVLYPREPHGLLERAHQLDFINRVLYWFGRYVKTTGTN